MLRYLNVFLFCLLTVILTACSAPTTANSSAQSPIVQAPNDPGYQPPANLPNKIEDILQSTSNFWTGKTTVGEWFYFRRNTASTNNNEMFHIEIIRPSTGVGQSTKSTHYYGLKQFTDAPVAGGIWKGEFYLKGTDGKLDYGTKMECQLKFITLREAEAKFFPKVSSDKTKDYGTFMVTAQ